MSASLCPPQSPASLSASSVAREIWIQESALAGEEGSSEGSTPHTSSGTFGRGVAVVDPRWQSRASIRLGLDFSTLPGGGGRGRQMALALGHWKESGHSPCLLGPFAGDSGAPRLSRPSYGSTSSSPHLRATLLVAKSTMAWPLAMLCTGRASPHCSRPRPKTRTRRVGKATGLLLTKGNKGKEEKHR